MKRKYFLLLPSFVLLWLQPAANAQTVKITSLGSRTGEFCELDRNLLFEDPSGVRILYDPGVTIAGGADPRLGEIHTILLTHVHNDHIGNQKLNQDPNAPTAGCTGATTQQTPTLNFNLAEIAAAKNSAIIVGRNMATFVDLKIQNIRGVPTAGCPSAGFDNEMRVPRSSPCAINLDFGGKRTVTHLAGESGVQIAVVPAHHDNTVSPSLNTILSDPLRTNLTDNGLPAIVGPATGYVLTFTNGLKVYLTGDTGITTEMETVVNRFYQPNLAVVHFDTGTAAKMGPEEAAFAMSRLVKPKAVIPLHMIEATTGGRVNPGTNTARFIALMGDTPVYVPKSGVTMEFDGDARCVAGCIDDSVSIGPIGTGISFDPATIQAGGSPTVTFSGKNLTDQMYFDIRFRSPGSTINEVALNWQQGVSAKHTIPIGTGLGTWTVTGVRAHQNRDDHTSDFTPISTTLTVIR